LCFWSACADTADRAVREPGLSLVDMAKHLGTSVSGVGYTVETGEAIARDNNYHLIDLLRFLRAFRFPHRYIYRSKRPLEKR